MSTPKDAADVLIPAITAEGTIDCVIIGIESAHTQTLSGNVPIASGEQVLTHGPDDHRLDADCER